LALNRWPILRNLRPSSTMAPDLSPQAGTPLGIVGVGDEQALDPTTQTTWMLVVDVVVTGVISAHMGLMALAVSMVIDMVVTHGVSEG